MIIALILFFAIVLLLVNHLGNDKRPSQQVTEIDLNREITQSSNAIFKIAGITRYCNYSDIGPICGELRKDPDNKYDKKAVMVIEANNEKILGYIAKVDQNKYYSIVGDNDSIPFIGYIEKFENDEGKCSIFGVIRAYVSNTESALEDAQNDWDYLQKVFKLRSYDKRIEALDKFKYNL